MDLRFDFGIVVERLDTKTSCADVSVELQLFGSRSQDSSTQPSRVDCGVGGNPTLAVSVLATLLSAAISIPALTPASALAIAVELVRKPIGSIILM